ncbi:MAG: glycoside hydrolase, partial [Cyanobacteria bacterium REEB65]|nr:glycoside hydrolase [Cyanobacteria bacterium REEB65]
AQEHVRRALDFFEARLGYRPAGMWPAEQAVSTATIELLAREGIRWAVSDENILAHCVGKRLARNAKGLLLEPDALCQPYWVDTPSGSVAMVFRDVVLSDLIGFSYAKVPGARAAQDLHERLQAIASSSSLAAPLVTIALDGENCWEHYPEDGGHFLRSFYDRISADPKIRLVTVSDYLQAHPPQRRLSLVHGGSWIGADFTTWIGDPVKNRAWDLLTDAREALDRYRGPRRAAAYDELLTAEGSDWFWWFGTGHDSGQDELFDEQFRLHLTNAYQLQDLPVPEALSQPIASAAPTELPLFPAEGSYDPTAGQGTMHAAAKTLGRIEYSTDSQEICFDIELAPGFGVGSGD